ncbi:MAG: hypothetical protein M1831_006784 [Alyxoria varia]|nr:MAG: hypothetical protein M1831_006784 [Alyxoria varia]
MEELLFSEWAGDGWGTEPHTKQNISFELSFVSPEDVAPFEKFFDIDHETMTSRSQCTLSGSTEVDLLELSTLSVAQALSFSFEVTGGECLPRKDPKQTRIMQMGFMWSGSESNGLRKDLGLQKTINLPSAVPQCKAGQEESSDLFCPLHREPVSFHEKRDLDNHVKLEHPELATLGVWDSPQESIFRRRSSSSAEVKSESSIKGTSEPIDERKEVNEAHSEAKSEPRAFAPESRNAVDAHQSRLPPGSSPVSEAPKSPSSNDAFRVETDITSSPRKRKGSAEDPIDLCDEPVSKSRKRDTQTSFKDPSEIQCTPSPKKANSKIPRKHSPRATLLEKFKLEAIASSKGFPSPKSRTVEAGPNYKQNKESHNEPPPNLNDRRTRSSNPRKGFESTRSLRSNSRAQEALQDNEPTGVNAHARRTGSLSKTSRGSERHFKETRSTTDGSVSHNSESAATSFAPASAIMFNNDPDSVAPSGSPHAERVDGRAGLERKVDSAIDPGPQPDAVSEPEQELQQVPVVEPLPAVQRPRLPVPKSVSGTKVFRTGSKRIVQAGEVLSDSDQDVDISWLVRSHHLSIDQMRGVTTEQKRFANLFNEHFQREQLNGQRYIPNALLRFVSAFSDVLNEKDMRRELSQKLMEMKLENIVSEADILDCLKVVDSGSGRVNKKRKSDAEDDRLAKTTKIEDARSSKRRLEKGSGCPKCKKAVEDPSLTVFCDNQACAYPAYHFKCADSASNPVETRKGNPISWLCPSCNPDCKIDNLRGRRSRSSGNCSREQDDSLAFAKHKDFYVPAVESAGPNELRSLMQDIDDLKEREPHGPTRALRQAFWDALKATASERIDILGKEKRETVIEQLQKRWGM